MPKTCLLAFAMMFIASVGHCQKSKIPALEKQIAELDKQIADLKAHGAEGNFLKLFSNYKVVQVIDPNTAIVNLRWRDINVTSMSSRLIINEEFHATLDTSGLTENRTYKLALEPSGETKTFTKSTSSKTIQVAAARDKAKVELERKLYCLKALAADLSYSKIVEEGKAKPFYLYKIDKLSNKKVKEFESKVTLEKVTSRRWSPDFENRGNLFYEFTLDLRDKDGDKVDLNRGGNFGSTRFSYSTMHKTTKRTFDRYLDNMAKVFKKYGFGPLEEDDEKRVEELSKLKAR